MGHSPAGRQQRLSLPSAPSPRSKNLNNSQSEVVSFPLSVEASAQVSLNGVSKPEAVLFPASDWRPREQPQEEGDVGPAVQHVYEVRGGGEQREQRAEARAHEGKEGPLW